MKTTDKATFLKDRFFLAGAGSGGVADGKPILAMAANIFSSLKRP